MLNKKIISGQTCEKMLVTKMRGVKETTGNGWPGMVSRGTGNFAKTKNFCPKILFVQKFENLLENLKTSLKR